MRLLILLRELGIGGAERQFLLLAKGLRARGHDVSIVALYARDRRWPWLTDCREFEVRTLFHRSPSGPLSTSLQLARACLLLRRVVAQRDPDVVYAAPRAVSHFLAWVATRTAAHPQLVWGHRGSPGRSLLKTRDRAVALITPVCRRVSATVPLVITNSEAGKRGLVDAGFRCGRFEVVDNGVDVDRFRRKPEAGRELRKQWGIQSSEVAIGLVGRLGPVKGFDLFLEAVGRLNARRAGIRPVLVDGGGASGREEIEACAARHGLGHRLIWVDGAEDMASVFTGLDLLCSASRAEGFSNVIAEAMACMVPCVVTDVGASARIVGDHGVVVPPEDVMALTDGLAQALQNRRATDGQLLRDRISECFGVDRMVCTTERLLQETLTAHKSGNRC